MGTNQIKKCTSDVISSLVLLFFLITLTVQLGAIPEESSTYPKILMGLSYIMVVIQLVRNVLKYKNSELVETQALEQAKQEAARLAAEAGAIEETIEIIEVEDVPLAYCVGNTCRVRVKAAGDLA